MLAATKAGVCAILNTYHHTEGKSYIERFHRSLKEEELWSSEYRYLMEARENTSRYLDEYNQDRPHRGVGNRTPKGRSRLLQFLLKTRL
jgi:transposase InsO family protein